MTLKKIKLSLNTNEHSSHVKEFGYFVKIDID